MLTDFPSRQPLNSSAIVSTGQVLGRKFWRKILPTWVKSENLAEFFADFRPSISWKSGRKKFHQESSTNSTSHKINFFHREIWNLGGTRVSILRCSSRRTAPRLASFNCRTCPRRCCQEMVDPWKRPGRCLERQRKSARTCL